MALITTVALVVLAAACDGGSAGNRSTGSSRAGESQTAPELSFSRCMRSHGVSKFPDPDPTGIRKEDGAQLGVSESGFQAASNACQHLLPNGGRSPDQGQLAGLSEHSLRFSRCVRGHGVDLPDPDSSGRIPDPASVGIDQGSAQFEDANQACGRYRPPYIPTNEAYNAWVRTQRS